MGRRPKNAASNTSKSTTPALSNSNPIGPNIVQSTTNITQNTAQLYKYSLQSHSYSTPISLSELKSQSAYTLSHLKFIDKMSKTHNSAYKSLSDFTIICPLCGSKFPASQGQIDINIAYIEDKDQNSSIKSPPDHLIVCSECSNSEWKKTREAQYFRVKITKEVRK